MLLKQSGEYYNCKIWIEDPPQRKYEKIVLVAKKEFEEKLLKNLVPNK